MAEQTDFEKSGQKIATTNQTPNSPTPTNQTNRSSVSNPSNPNQPSSIYQAGGEVLGSADKSGNRTIYSRIENGKGGEAIGTLTGSGRIILSETGEQRYASFRATGSTSQTPKFSMGGEAEKPTEPQRPTTPESNIIGATPQGATPQQPDYARLDYSANTPERKGLLESTYQATASYLFGRKYEELPSAQQEAVKKTALESEASYYRGAIKEEARIKSGYTREPSPYLEAITGGQFGTYLKERGVEPPKIDTSVPSVSAGATPPLAPSPSPTVATGEQTADQKYTYTYMGKEITEQQAKDIEMSNKVMQDVSTAINFSRVAMARYTELQTGTSEDVIAKENIKIIAPKGYNQAGFSLPFAKNDKIDIGDISEKVSLIKKYSPELKNVQASVVVNPFGGENTIIMPIKTEDISGQKIQVEQTTPSFFKGIGDTVITAVGNVARLNPLIPEEKKEAIATYYEQGTKSMLTKTYPLLFNENKTKTEKTVESGTVSYSAVIPVPKLENIMETTTTTPEGVSTTTLTGTENISISATQKDIVIYEESDFYKHPQTETGKMFKSFLEPSIFMAESMPFDIGKIETYPSAIPKFIAEYGEKPIVVGAESMHLGLLPEKGKEDLLAQSGYAFGGLVYSFAGGTSIGTPFSIASSGRYLAETPFTMGTWMSGKSAFLTDSVYMQSASGRLGLFSDIALKTNVGLAGISYTAGYTIGSLTGQDPVKSGLSAVVGSAGAIGGTFAPISLGKIAISDIITGGTGMALYTAEYDKTSTPEQLATSFAMGGAIGGVIGVAGAYASEGKIPSINVGTSRYYVETAKGMQERIGYTGVWLTKGSETGWIESQAIPFISRKTGWDLSGRAIQMGGISDFTIPSGATKVLPTDILAEQSLRPMAQNLYENQAIIKYLGGVGYMDTGLGTTPSKTISTKTDYSITGFVGKTEQDAYGLIATKEGFRIEQNVPMDYKIDVYNKNIPSITSKSVYPEIGKTDMIGYGKPISYDITTAKPVKMGDLNAEYKTEIFNKNAPIMSDKDIIGINYKIRPSIQVESNLEIAGSSIKVSGIKTTGELRPIPKGEISTSSEWKKYSAVRKLVEPIYKGDIPAQITFEDVLENAPRFKGGLGKSSLEFFKQFRDESMMYGSATMKMKYGEAGLPREIHDIDVQLYGKGYTPEQIAQKYVAFQQAKGYNVKIAKGETSQVVRQMETGEWEKVLDIHVSGYEPNAPVPFGRTPESLGFHSQLPVREGEFYFMKAGESATRKGAGATTWMKNEQGDWIVGATERRAKDVGDLLETTRYIGETGKMLPKGMSKTQYLADVKATAEMYGYKFQDKLTVSLTEPKVMPKIAELSIKPSTYISPAVSKGLTVSSGKLTGISMPKASYPSPSQSKSMPLSASPYNYPSVSKSISTSPYKSVSSSVSKSISKSVYSSGYPSEYPSVSTSPSSYPSKSVSVSKSQYPSEYPSYYPSQYSPKISEPVPPVKTGIGGIPWLDIGGVGKGKARKFSGKTRGLIYASLGKIPKMGKKGGF